MTFYSKNTTTEEDSSPHISLNNIVPMVTQSENGIQMTIRKLNQQETHALKVELLLKEVSSAQKELETMKEKCKDIEKENFKMVQESFEHKNTITNLEGANTQMMLQLQMFQRQMHQFQFQMQHHHHQQQQQQQQQKPMQVMMPIAQQVLVPNRSAPQMMPQTYYALPPTAASGGNIPQNSPQHHGGGTQFSSYNNPNPQQQNYNNNNNNGERNNNQSSNKNYKANKGRRAYDSRKHKRGGSNYDDGRGSSNYDDRRNNKRNSSNNDGRRNKRNSSNNDRRNKRNNSNNDRRPREQRNEALLNPNSPPVPVSADHDQTIYIPPTHHKKSLENPSQPTISVTDNEKRNIAKFNMDSPSSETDKKVIKPVVNVRPAARKKSLKSNIEDETLQSTIPFVTSISSENTVDSFTAPSMTQSMRLKTKPIIENPKGLFSTTVLPPLMKDPSSSSSYKSEFFGSGSWKSHETSTSHESDLIIVEDLKDFNLEKPDEISE